jgi:uroporphyrinogen decarboxylase
VTTSRDRFIQTLEFQPADPPWMRRGFPWPETVEVWLGQGYDGRPLDDVFDVDQLVRVDPWYGPVPEFEYQVVEEDERTKTYVNHEGIVMREFKESPDTSMPQFVRFPVENLADFERLAAERLVLNPDQRLNETWRRQVLAGRQVQSRVAEAMAEGHVGVPVDGVERAAAEGEPPHEQVEEWPRQCWADRWGGFFGALRNMMGVENLCLAFYDQPALVERMMEQRADAIIEITAAVLEVTDFDVFWFWEDMAYNHGPLIGPELFRRFALKHYRRVCDWLHSRGIRHIGLDSDGDIRTLIPIWLDAGIDHLWPFEVQAGMDVVEIRGIYGHDLALMGGIDKRAVAKGGEVMRAEVDRVVGLVADGGYIPELDHSAPPDISWLDFCEFTEYLKFRLGRG